MKYNEWKNGELNKPWKELLPNLWEDYVKNEKDKIGHIKTILQDRLQNCELWFKEGKDLSGEIHFLKEILEKIELIEILSLIDKEG